MYVTIDKGQSETSTTNNSIHENKTMYVFISNTRFIPLRPSPLQHPSMLNLAYSFYIAHHNILIW